MSLFIQDRPPSPCLRGEGWGLEHKHRAKRTGSGDWIGAGLGARGGYRPEWLPDGEVAEGSFWFPVMLGGPVPPGLDIPLRAMTLKWWKFVWPCGLNWQVEKFQQLGCVTDAPANCSQFQQEASFPLLNKERFGAKGIYQDTRRSVGGGGGEVRMRY